MRLRSSIGRPASDPYVGKPVTTEKKVRAEKLRKCMGFIVIVVGDVFSGQRNEAFILALKIHIPRFRVIEQPEAHTLDTAASLIEY